VDVHHRSNLSFPLTLRASLITQPEKDNMLTWSPEDSHEAVRAEIVCVSICVCVCVYLCLNIK